MNELKDTGLSKLRSKLPTAEDVEDESTKKVWQGIHNFLDKLDASIQVF